MKIVKVCLLRGKKCYWQSYKYIPRNSEFQIKICRAEFPCSQQYITNAQSLAKKGPCENLPLCQMPSEACKLAENLDAELPRKRWINCLYGGNPHG
jgi:hypothetical protein